MADELKPCPFHKEAIIPSLYHGSNDMQGNWARIECPVCGVSIEAEGIGDQRPIATTLWSTRHERTCHKVPGKMHYGERRPKCSECGYGLGDDRWEFCPNCGAKVVG